MVDFRTFLTDLLGSGKIKLPESWLGNIRTCMYITFVHIIYLR